MGADKTETLRLTTRGYELSSRGTIGPAQLLRYLEHSRWQTIARSDKIPLRKLWSLGVVRAQALEVFRHIAFDVEIEITTWLSHTGKTSMSLSHDVVQVGDGVRVARSTATIVSLDPSRSPQPISEDAKEYVVNRDALSVERFEPGFPGDAWQRTLELRPSDQDLQLHVNHARYVDLVEDTRWFAAHAHAYGPGDWDGPVKRVVISYEREARVFDAVTARTWRRSGADRTLDFALVKGDADVVARAVVELAR